MRCEDVQEELSGFLDDELDPVRSGEIQRHLDSCPSCTGALERMSDLGERLRAEAPYYRAPDPLRNRVSQAAWSSASRARPTGRRMGALAPRWLSAAAAVLVVAAGTWLFTALHLQEGIGLVERDVVSSHIRSLMANHLTDVASTDQHTVKPWFNGKLDFSPPVSDLSASGFPLIGGRLDYVHGRPVAALVYQHRKHWINVFTWPQEGKESVRSPRTQQGYHVIRETHGGMAYWIVSDLNAEELSTFARLLTAGGSGP
jgi:anti-sigma factor RsiW